jgi:hypothetical protein
MTAPAIDIRSQRKLRFSDFADEPEVLDGDKIPIERVLNKEIEIIGYRVTSSKYPKNKSGKCLTLQFTADDGERHILFTGSDVLIEQTERYGEKIPFLAVIKKINKYYTLS